MRPRGATTSPPTPTLGRGRAKRVWLGITPLRLLVWAFGRTFGFVLAFALFASVAPEVAAQDMTAANREVSDLESDTQRLMASRVRPHDLKSDTFVEERLTDGELYLRLEDYLRSAILLMDIVEHYPTHRAYPEALFLLGESLFFAGDYLGARKRYAEVIDRSSDPAFSPYLQMALSRLIEIAIHTRDFREVDGYFARLEALPSSTLSVTTAYFPTLRVTPPFEESIRPVWNRRERASSPSRAAPSSPFAPSTSWAQFMSSAVNTSTPSPRSTVSSATSLPTSKSERSSS